MAAAALVAMVVVVFAGVGVAAGATTWDVNPGEGIPIQDAIDDAAAGDTIYVHAGEYCENVDVWKQVTLRGDGADVVTVQAADAADHVFEVTADWVNISGFTVAGATDRYNVAGIYLINTDNCNISDNAALNSRYGIRLDHSSNNIIANNTASNNGDDGISLQYSNENKLTGNTASNNDEDGCYQYSPDEHTTISYTPDEGCGIRLLVSSNNTLASNIANSNNWCGISIGGSSNNTLGNNMMSENTYNFGVDGYSLSEYIHDIDTSNTVDEKPIYYWVDRQDGQIPGDAGFVGVVDSTNITVRDLTLTNNSEGVLFAYTENSRLENVTVSNNRYGIYMDHSSNSTLASNAADLNDWTGICLAYSSNNTLASNSVNSNSWGGITLSSSNNNTLASNTADLNDWYGICLEYSSNNMLANNTASNNRYGICMDHSSNNTLANNTADLNDWYGIRLEYSSNNMLANNTASNNRHGIYIDRSSNNTITNNMMLENTYNFGVDGYSLSEYIHDIGTSNTVDEKPIYYWVDRQDGQIPGDAGFVGVVDSTNITVRDLTLTNNSEGVLFAYTENSRLENVTVSNNRRYGIYTWHSSNNMLASNNASNNSGGICLKCSSNNTLANNTASNNGHGVIIGYSSNNTLANNTASNNGYGILLQFSSNNMIMSNTANSNDYGITIVFSSENTLHHNNFINNTQYNAYDSDGTNQWDSGSAGNYYSDYTGTDNNTDGIGDTPHPIPGGGSIDRFPLMQPWAGDPPKKGDLNGDGRITSADAAIALQFAAGGSASCDPVAFAAGDMSGDHRVTSLDALMIMRLAAGVI
ncbi:MAG: Cell surface glycoprotein [Candidatus Methanogaster sp.]|nr:MAG: Cell surface glycoprotein [ANME-2 cluster archaeon]